MHQNKRRFRNRFSLARHAYRHRDVDMAKAAHTREHLGELLHEQGVRGQHLADAVLGATDGIVTTFAVVAGAAGASLPPAVVIIMGCANLLADGFSMAASNYLGARSQQQYWLGERKRELWEVENLPEAEQDEIRRIYHKKGFRAGLLERIVDTLTRDRKQWVDEMMREELGIQEEKIAPLRSGVVTFASFVVAGALPLFPYLFAFFRSHLMPTAFLFSILLTTVALFAVGAARSLLTRSPWWKSGLQILGVSGLAAFLAFLVGHALREWLG